MEVKKAVEQYLQSIKRLEFQTQQGYKARLLVFVEWCEQQGVQLEQIRNIIIDDFVQHLYTNRRSHSHTKPQLSTYTATGYVRCIKTFLGFCLDEEEYQPFVKYAVIQRIKLPKRDKALIKIFTEVQLRALFAATKQEMDEHLQMRDRTILAVLIDCGVRANELCTLILEDTHTEPDDPYIRVWGKGSKQREVGLGRLSREALQHYIRTYRAKAKPGETVFIGRYKEEPLMVNGLEKITRRLGEWAEITGVRCSPHTFRHTYAVRFILSEGEGSIFKLSLLMGHEDIRITEHYLRTVQAMQVRKKVGSVLDDLKIN